MATVFYKYRADSKFTESIFTTGDVFLSTAIGLNDPFECSVQEIAKHWIESQVKQMKQAAVAGFLIEAFRYRRSERAFFGLSTTELEELTNRQHDNIDQAYASYRQFMLDKNGHSPSDCERFFANIDAQLNSVGIFSMSANPDHPLMWAHYANDHKGLCIGFEASEGSKLAAADHCLPVQYSDSLPEFDEDGLLSETTFSVDTSGRSYVSSFKIAFTDKTFQKAISTKPTVWSYENEWRYVEPYDGLFQWPGPLSEITFGLKCSDERRKHYIALAEQYVPNDVRLYEMRRIHGTNTLERVPLEIPLTRARCKIHPAHISEDGPEIMDPQQFAARIESLIKQLQIGPALFEIDQNLKNHPESPVLWSLRGMALGAAGQHAEALLSFQKLTEACPDVAQGWYQLGVALTQLDQLEKAVVAYRRAIELDPNDSSAVFNLGNILACSFDASEEGLKLLRRAERLGHRRAHAKIIEIETILLKLKDE
ncbi:MAG: hypothetical protein JWP89_4806 [Schlesneria sp.]|nr:hypothetical protein [Schlesneria sp.]